MKFFIFILLSFSLSFTVWGRNQADRHRMLNDKFSNDNLLRAYGHDWFFDIKAVMTNGIVKTVEDLEDATDITGTDAEKIIEINSILDENNDVEHFGSFELGMGVPFPSFKLGSVGIIPDFRIHFEIGSSFSLTDRLDVFTFLGVPVANDPVILLYLKQDVKVGVNFKLEFGPKHYAEFFYYGMNRFDRQEYIQGSDILDSAEVIDLDKPKNNQNALVMDAKYGIKGDNAHWFLSVEELNLTTFSDKLEEAGDLVLKIAPMGRFHYEYAFRFDVLNLTPFAGVHLRERYDLDDGYYLGFNLDFPWMKFVDFGGQVMLDSEYITLHPWLEVLFFEANYTMRIPTHSRTDDFKNAIVHTANIRFSF